MPYDPPLSDEALLAAWAAGDDSAARLLVARLAPAVLRLARRLLNDPTEAEDVTQEAMLRLWQVAPRWQPGAARPASWLHRVAVNLALDRLRRRQGPGRGPGLDEVPEPEDEAPGPAEAMIAADRLAALDQALALLPDRQRAAVVLRHLEGLTNPEIAVQLGVGVEAVESLTARGKRTLARLLAGRRADLGFDR